MFEIEHLILIFYDSKFCIVIYLRLSMNIRQVKLNTLVSSKYDQNFSHPKLFSRVLTFLIKKKS